MRSIIPFDEAITYHKLLGRMGFCFATIHALCHIVDIKCWGDKSRRHLYDLAFPEGPRQPTYQELATSQVAATGVLLYLVMIVAYAFALDFPRRSKLLSGTRLGKVFKLNFVHSPHITSIHGVRALKRCAWFCNNNLTRLTSRLNWLPHVLLPYGL